MRFVRDRSWRWVGEHAVLAGSPHRLFRLTPAGAEVARRIEAGGDVEPSGLVDRLLDAGAVHPAPLASDDTSSIRPDDVTVVTPQLGGTVVHGRVTVDDASEPPLAGATVRLDRNAGPAGARNAGRAAVDTPYVLFVDADVDIAELDPAHPRHERWWSTLLRHFEDPAVGLVAPRVTGDDGSSLDLGVEPGRIRAGTRIGYAPGAALLVRTEAFDDVGGFDPGLRLGEDVDLVWRLDAAGWRCRFEPGATVHHRPRPTLAGQLRQQVKYGSSSGSLALRHPRAMAPYASGASTAAAWVAFGLGRRVVAAGLAAASAARLASAAPDLDRRAAFEVATRGHLAAGAQALVAVRRAWWPLLVVPALVSRRVRVVLAAAVVTAPPLRVAKDVAFSIGLWRSSLACRTSAALRPMIRR